MFKEEIHSFETVCMGFFAGAVNLVQYLDPSRHSTIEPAQTVILAAISVALALVVLTVFLLLRNRSRARQREAPLSIAAELTIVVAVVLLATISGAGLAALAAFLFPGLVDIKTQVDSVSIDATGPLAVFIVGLIVFVPASARIALRIASRKQKKGAGAPDDKDRAPIDFVPPSRRRK